MTLHRRGAVTGLPVTEGFDRSQMKFRITPSVFGLRRIHRLAADRSRHGSDSPPDCHLLAWRRFATLGGAIVA